MTSAVTHEPATYRPDGFSYFGDLALRLTGNASKAATDRLDRHDVEMRLERAKREREGRAAERRMTDAGFVFERRANPDRTPGQGGNFDPPSWLIEDYAMRRRPERVLADLARQYPLPTGVQSVNVPILSTGTNAQAETDLASDTDQDIVDTATTSPVVTVSGQSDAAMQLLEQSPRNAAFDALMFADLANAADADLEQMMTAGTGTAGQFTGIANISGITTVTYTSGSPTAGAFYTAAAQAGAQLADARSLRPDAYVMRFGRWAWLAAQEDDQHRPWVPPTDRFITVGNAATGPTPIGSIAGVPVVTSEALPTTLGTGANQDIVYAVRSSDFLLFEGEPNLRVHTEVLSGTLSCRIQLHRYCAAILGRYPSGIAQVVGSGMAYPSSY